MVELNNLAFGMNSESKELQKEYDWGESRTSHNKVDEETAIYGSAQADQALIQPVMWQTTWKNNRTHDR